MKIHVGNVRNTTVTDVKAAAKNSKSVKSKPKPKSVQAAGSVGKLARKVKEAVVDQTSKLGKSAKEIGQKGLDQGKNLIKRAGKEVVKRGGPDPKQLASAIKKATNAAKGKVARKLSTIVSDLNIIVPSPAWYFVIMYLSTLQAQYYGVKALFRAKEIEKNGGKPPAPYVNASAYIADAWPFGNVDFRILSKTQDLLFKSKQFIDLKKTLGKEEWESLKSRIESKVKKAPKEEITVGGSLNSIANLQASARKDNIQLTDIEESLQKDFVKALEQMKS